MATQAEMETNKQVVKAFYNCVVNTKDYDSAQKYLGSGYVQHNPLVKDGPEGLKEFINGRKAQHPDSSSEIVHIFADGDYVVLHIHSFWPPKTHRAIMEIFRLADGKIEEHWDTIQIVPETSANPNGMF